MAREQDENLEKPEADGEGESSGWSKVNPVTLIYSANVYIGHLKNGYWCWLAGQPFFGLTVFILWTECLFTYPKT